MIEKEIKIVDCVIYVLDARAPLSTINPHFDRALGNKPRLYVLNKADLVPAQGVEKWRAHFVSQGMRAIVTNSLSKAYANEIVKNLTELNAEMINRYALKGVKKTLKAMVIGCPNTGKSTLINSLAPEKKTVTGNRPGVTRGKQWVKIGEYLELLDSPGVLYPDFSNKKKAVNLALIGSIKDEVVNALELAVEGFKLLRISNEDEFKKRYSIDKDTPENEVLTQVAKARGFLLKGGEYDLDKASQGLISDIRKGYLGKFLLD